MHSPGTVDWSAALSVGDPRIDAEHRELLELVNLIAREVAERPGGAPMTLVNRLVSASRDHFQHEEERLQARGYPDLEQHRAEHAQYMERMVLLVGLCRRGEMTPRVVELLAEWFVEHLFSHDMPYRRWLHERRAG